MLWQNISLLCRRAVHRTPAQQADFIIVCISWNNKKCLNNLFERVWNQRVLIHFKVLPHGLHGENEEIPLQKISGMDRSGKKSHQGFAGQTEGELDLS
jgi:hypothetical protein